MKRREQKPKPARFGEIRRVFPRFAVRIPPWQGGVFLGQQVPLDRASNDVKTVQKRPKRKPEVTVFGLIAGKLVISPELVVNKGFVRSRWRFGVAKTPNDFGKNGNITVQEEKE